MFGPIFVKASMSRFASIFSILHASGVPILESITILTETFGNAAISRIFKNARAEIEEGKGIATPLMNAKHFTSMVVTMISIGEESGNLDEMLSNYGSYTVIANHFIKYAATVETSIGGGDIQNLLKVTITDTDGNNLTALFSLYQ